MAAVMKTATATGSVASFWSPKPAAIKSLKVYFEPKQAGEGDPSPDNVRPIEGWNGVEVTHCKEIVPKTGWEVTRTYRTIKIDGDYRFYFKFIEKDSTIELPSNFSFGVALVYPREAGEAGKGYNWAIEKNVFKTEQSNKITYPSAAVGKNGMYLMIYPSTQEAFDAFFAKYEVQMARDTSEPQTYTSSWESEVGTAYGGYVDLISGELTVTKAKYTFTGSEADGIIYNATQNDPSGVERHYYLSTALDRVYAYSSSSTVLSNIGIGYIQANREKKPPILIFVGTPSRQVGLYVASSICEPTVESFCDYLNEHNIEIVNILLNPVTHQLTPQQLSTFIGRNNLFSNATKVEVEYEYADSPELEVIKKRIALNEPHLGNASGSIANFYTDMASPIKSLKVNFEAKQSGTGDPSPDNVRPITGVDQINVCTSGKNICHIVGYSAKNTNIPTATRSLTNNYGTTLSTIDFQLPDSSVVVTQTDHPNTTIYNSYTNGYFTIIEDNMILGKYYNVSFRVTDVTNNPLNASLSDIVIYAPSGGARTPSVDGDRLVYHDFLYKQYASVPTRHGIEVRNCGISFTLSEFMVTEVTEEDQTYEPYTGNIIPYNLSELGTQYGGYVDLVKGTLTKTWTKLTTTWGELDEPGTVIENNTRKTFTLPITGIKDAENSIFNAGPYIWSNSQDVPHYYINSTGRVLYVVLPNDTDSSFPIEVAYKLAEPITYQLTPQQIKTFRGTNNVYSFDGTVDVKYWLHSDVKTERKTVMWNQWAFEINSDNYRPQNANYTTISFDDGIATVEVIKDTTIVYESSMVSTKSIPWDQSHLYYMRQDVYISEEGQFVNIMCSGWYGTTKVASNQWATIKAVHTPDGTRRVSIFLAYTTHTNTLSAGVIKKVKNPIIVDLTLMFGAGNEPATVEEFEHLCAINGVDLTKPQAYDEGTERSWIIN